MDFSTIFLVLQVRILISGHILSKIGENTTPGDLMWGSQRKLQPWATRNYSPKSAFAPKTSNLIESAQDIVDLLIQSLEDKVNNKEEENYEETWILRDEVDALGNFFIRWI